MKKFLIPSQISLLVTFSLMFFQMNKMSAQQNQIEMFSVADTITTFDPVSYKESTQIVKTEMEVHSHPDEMPYMSNCVSREFKNKEECSQQKLQEYISKFLDYPEEAKAKGIQGTVDIEFIINEDGGVQFVTVKKSDNKLLNSAAMDVIQKMNKYFAEDPWVPGFHEGKRVATKMLIPIKFAL